MFSDLVAALGKTGARLLRDKADGALERAEKRALATVMALASAFAASPAPAPEKDDPTWAEFEVETARERDIVRQTRGK